MDIDGVEEPQPLVVTVKIEGDQLYADFTGTAPQVRRPVNCPINFSRAYVAVPVKMICDPTLPNNQGTYRPITLNAPDGSLLNPTYPAACFWRIECWNVGGGADVQDFLPASCRIGYRRNRARCRPGNST